MPIQSRILNFYPWELVILFIYAQVGVNTKLIYKEF